MKGKILEHKNARKDDKFKEFVESTDKLESLQFMLEDLDGKKNGLPPVSDDAKGKDADSGKHPSDKAFDERYEKQTGRKPGRI